MKYNQFLKLFENSNNIFKPVTDEDHLQRQAEFKEIERKKIEAIKKEIAETKGKLTIGSIVRFTYIDPDEKHRTDIEHDFRDYTILSIHDDNVLIKQIYPNPAKLPVKVKYAELLDNIDDIVGDRYVKIIPQNEYIDPKI